MSLFADYIKERGVKSIVENEAGFLTFIINGQECYIEDLYVAPSHRKQHLASEMADEAVAHAKAAGCKVLTGSVVPSARGSTESVKVLLAYGFRIAQSQSNIIYFVKEI